MSYHYEEAVKGELNTLLGNAGDEPSEMHIYRKMTDAMEKPLLQAMMEKAHGNQSACAVELGINRATLRIKLRRHGLL